MNLIKIYIQEVTRRLPEKNRKDIALELQSTIEDMLPEEYGEEEVKAVLAKMGSPAALASGYRDRPMHLIGPRYFDVYITLLKMILPIAAVVSLIVMTAQYVIGHSGEQAILQIVLNLLGEGIRKIVDVGVQTFFWLTIFFVIMERVDVGKDNEALTANLQPWTPDDLKKIPYIPRKKSISTMEVFGGFLWTAIWATVYFYADHLIGVYESGKNGLEFVIPALNQQILNQFWPAVAVVIGLEVFFSLYQLLKRHWTRNMAIANAIVQFVVTIVFIFIVSNKSILTNDFLMRMADAFTVSPNQFKTWLTVGAMVIFMMGAAYNAYDGFRKAKIR